MPSEAVLFFAVLAIICVVGVGVIFWSGKEETEKARTQFNQNFDCSYPKSAADKKLLQPRIDQRMTVAAKKVVDALTADENITEAQANFEKLRNSAYGFGFSVNWSPIDYLVKPQQQTVVSA